MDELRRRLGLGDAVVIGLGSMIGAGVFVAFAPAARTAGSGLPPRAARPGSCQWSARAAASAGLCAARCLLWGSVVLATGAAAYGLRRTVTRQ